MIKSVSVYTYELDDPAMAVAEIQKGLENFALLEHTIGIVMCDPEYVESDVYAAVCASLSFPIAGATTMTQAAGAEAGSLILTLMVLTSSDVFFETGYTEPIENGSCALEPTRASYKAAWDRLRKKAPGAVEDNPNLVFVFPPLLSENAGDIYIDVFEALCPGTPLFGTLAVSESIEFDNCHTLYNGEASLDRMAFILVAGNVSPRFLIGTIHEKNKTAYTGEITKSKGNIVHKINEVKTSEYFERIGLAKSGVLDKGVQFVPFLMDMRRRQDYDGVPVLRALIALDKDGNGVCRGNMYQNSMFHIMSPCAEDILSSSADMVEKIKAVPDKQAVIVFSCIVRRMFFGITPLAEAEMVARELKDGAPYMLAYAGGEICPTTSRGNTVTNRFHNYTIIACIL